MLLLGEPDACSEDDLMYSYGWTKVGAVWIIAGYGGAAGGEFGKSFALKLTFDTAGRLAKIELGRELWGSSGRF